MGRLLFPALFMVAAYYALFGGEYSVPDTMRFASETEAATAQLERLRFEADSLETRADALENDPQTLETIARESFGMIRSGEVLYRFADRAAEDADEGSDE